LDTLNELSFVIRVLVFSYVLFWLYITFRDSQALFGLATIAMGYILFLHGISVVLVVCFFVFFVMFGSHLQMLMLFGLMPLLGLQHGGHRFYNPEKERKVMQDAQAKLGRGEQITQYEEYVMQQNGAGMASGQAEEEMARRRMGG